LRPYLYSHANRDAGASKIAWGIMGFAGGDSAAGLLEEEEREPWFGLSTSIPLRS